MTKYKDHVDLHYAIKRGDIELEPLLCEREDFNGMYKDSLEYLLLQFGRKGPREIITGPTKSRMIPIGKQVLINEDYQHCYCRAV